MQINTELLEARGIGRYSTRWLLRDASLALCGGEALAITGPTGAGKTLFLRALALLDPIDEGEIIWRGDSIAAKSVPDFRRQVIYLHQRSALLEGTVEDSLRMPFTFKVHAHLTFNRENVLQLLAGIGRDGDFLARQTRDLSGGEAQIVSLIRAIQLNPSVLLLDEPTASLDQASSEVIEGFVSQWKSQDHDKRAVVWVTHNGNQAIRVADRIVELNSGRLT